MAVIMRHFIACTRNAFSSGAAFFAASAAYICYLQKSDFTTEPVNREALKLTPSYLNTGAKNHKTLWSDLAEHD
jgi:hypothetical protein